ncbi:hypothetical protein EJ110_NYTH19900 [Nymphaea thermarum]|nr:hypothetical protein EJ110_NYTH19900 [Nymphaea thermarum]
MAKAASPTELDSVPFAPPPVSAPPPAAPAAVYADSLDSSPRSRGTDSESFRWDDVPPAAASAAVPPAPSTKLRLMCSYGGRIIPRPHDKSLCYLGGETRIVVADRHASLADLTARLSRLLLAGRPFSLKYQLPHEDLDSLISVTTDDDLDNMIEEYDRCASSPKPSRLRLFLFPAKPDTASSLGSLLEDAKAETWFVDALNGTVPVGLPRGFSDTAAASVNRLLGLDSGVTAEWDHHDPAASEDSGAAAAGTGSGGKAAKAEVQSVPDSPMMETSSSFGSTSSAPSVSNLPSAGTKAEDPAVGGSGVAVGLSGIEEQLGQMTLAPEIAKRLPEHEVPARENPAPPPQAAAKPVYYQDSVRVPTAPVANPTAIDPKRELAEHSYRVQMQYPADPGFLVPQALPPEYHYVHPQMAAIPPPPMPSFYQVHHHPQQTQQQSQQPQVDQPIPMFFLHPQASTMATLRQNQAYNLAAYQSAVADSSTKPVAAPAPPPAKDPSAALPYPPPPAPSTSRPPPRPELTSNIYRTAASAAAMPLTSTPLVHASEQQQYAGYRHLLRPPTHLGYDYGDPFPQQIFYSQQIPVSAAAGEAAAQLSPDTKQARS